MLNSYLTDTVIHKVATRDVWGKPSTVSTSIRARVEYRTKLVQNEFGKQVVSTAQVSIKNRNISHADLLTIDGIDRKIIAISRERDFSANLFLIVAVA